MSMLTNPDLIRWIECPACEGDLAESAQCLKCTCCGREYAIRQGIPLLYPPNIDLLHLQEEENLAGVMLSKRANPREQFNLTQWKNSKQEFWSMVKANIQPPPKLMINIGCGYDPGFGEFEKQGYAFVNLDMVYTMLETLQKDCGAKSCVGGDAGRMPFKKGIFDYVVAIDLIHHEVEKLPAMLEAFRDLLRPGGILFLEDPNAWGMFQMAKSILLPRPIYAFLRSAYHWVKRSRYKPANYEFPTSVWHVTRMLRRLGFQAVKVYANNSYPCICERNHRFYKLFSQFEFVRKYHNYHYMLSATKQ